MIEPTCVECGRMMRPFKNDVWAIKMREKDHKYDFQKADSIWKCDIWRCPDCGFKIATGWGKAPVSSYSFVDFGFIWASAKTEEHFFFY